MFENVCKYYPGPGVPVCKAAIPLDQYRQNSSFDWLAQLPCIQTDENKDPKSKCSRFELLTLKEQQDQHKTMQDSMKTLIKIAPILRNLKRNSTEEEGTEDCPVCGGILSWMVVGENRRIHIQCSKIGCADFTEQEDLTSR